MLAELRRNAVEAAVQVGHEVELSGARVDVRSLQAGADPDRLGPSQPRWRPSVHLGGQPDQLRPKGGDVGRAGAQGLFSDEGPVLGVQEARVRAVEVRCRPEPVRARLITQPRSRARAEVEARGEAANEADLSQSLRAPPQPQAHAANQLVAANLERASLDRELGLRVAQGESPVQEQPFRAGLGLDAADRELRGEGRDGLQREDRFVAAHEGRRLDLDGDRDQEGVLSWRGAGWLGARADAQSHDLKLDRLAHAAALDVGRDQLELVGPCLLFARRPGDQASDRVDAQPCGSVEEAKGQAAPGGILHLGGVGQAPASEGERRREAEEARPLGLARALPLEGHEGVRDAWNAHDPCLAADGPDGRGAELDVKGRLAVGAAEADEVGSGPRPDHLHAVEEGRPPAAHEHHAALGGSSDFDLAEVERLGAGDDGSVANEADLELLGRRVARRVASGHDHRGFRVHEAPLLDPDRSGQRHDSPVGVHRNRFQWRSGEEERVGGRRKVVVAEPELSPAEGSRPVGRAGPAEGVHLDRQELVVAAVGGQARELG